MYRLVRDSKLPSWLKVLINVALTLTVVYWLGYMVYKILDVFRLFLHTLTEKKIFWIEFGIVVIVFIGTCLYLQYNTDIHPFTNAYEWLLNVFNLSRDYIANLIHS